MRSSVMDAHRSVVLLIEQERFRGEHIHWGLEMLVTVESKRMGRQDTCITSYDREGHVFRPVQVRVARGGVISSSADTRCRPQSFP